MKSQGRMFRRSRVRAAALLESLIMLMILAVIFAFAFHLAPAYNTMTRLNTETRRHVWRNPAQWHHHWDVDNDRSWTPYRGEANGSIFTPAVPLSSFGEGQMVRPRGDGEALQHLQSRVGSRIQQSTGNSSALDFYRRLWNNLPGRKELTSVVVYADDEEPWKTPQQVFGSIQSHYETDMASWVHSQMPAWLIAQYGPMREINEAFSAELSSVPAEFRRMAREVLHAWFEEEHMYNWNHRNAVQPGG